MSTAEMSGADAAQARLAAQLVGLGAFGIFLTCGAYLLAGEPAAMPGGAATAAAAISATPQAAGWMRVAGLVGMPGDILAAVGCLMAARLHRAQPLAMAGWVGMSLTSLLFVLVDAMVGFVLPAQALAEQAVSVYPAWRAWFEVLFIIGTWAMGISAAAIACGRFGWPAWALWLLRMAAMLGFVAGCLGLAGWPVAPMLGGSIALTVVALMGWAVAMKPAPTMQACP